MCMKPHSRHNAGWLTASLANSFSYSSRLRFAEAEQTCIYHGSNKNNENGLVATIKTSAERKAFGRDAAITEECRKRLEEAVDRLEQHHIEGSYAVYAGILRDCGNAKALAEGRRVHGHIARSSYCQNTFLLNLLVQMYAHCGHLDDARRVFDGMAQQNLYSWNIMLAGYAQNGHLKEAKILFEKTPQKNVVSWNAMITAYAQNGHLQNARTLFDEMLERDVVTWNAMLSAYSRSGHLQDARILFEEMPLKNRISWNAMVSAYAQNGHGREALELFRVMDLEGVPPDKITLVSVVTACACLGALAEGREIHATITQIGLESETEVATVLINLYGKCRRIEDAISMFKKMPHRNVVACTAMITVYGQNGHLQEARRLFEEMPIRVTITWNAMLAAYAQHAQHKEALQLFRVMDIDGVKPDTVTIVNILEACVSLSALADGKLIHGSIVDTGFAADAMVGTALLNMYAKCGSLDCATSMFTQMTKRNTVSWNAILAAYTQAGHGMKALEIFHTMQLEGEQPDKITFLSVLSACSHAGFLRDGLQYFVSLQQDHAIVPEVGLYGCMVDLLARAGWLVEAEELINSMPFEPDTVAWTALLGGCKVFGDMKRGALAAEHAHEVDPGNPSAFLLLSNMYANSRGREHTEVVKWAMNAKWCRSLLPGTSSCRALAISCGIDAR